MALEISSGKYSLSLQWISRIIFKIKNQLSLLFPISKTYEVFNFVLLRISFR